MAQDRVLGEQVDIIDLTSDIAADATAIGNIATGLANDPTAAAELAAGLDHADIGTGIGSNSHLDIDTHIVDGTVHFTTITGLSDVNAPAPAEGNVLSWQVGSGTWIPGIRVENPMTANLDVNSSRIITVDLTTAENNKAILIYAGANSYAGGGYKAGGVALRGGDGTNGNIGGDILFACGDTTGADTGAQMSITGGNTNNATGKGGVIFIFGGDGSGGADGGDTDIRGGFSSHATGGEVLIKGGPSGVTAGTGGGDVTITGGLNLNVTTPQNGGDVNIVGGATTIGGGISGSINIRPGGSTGNTDGNINLYAPSASASNNEAIVKLWSETSNSSVALKAPVFVGSPTVDRTWVLPQDDPSVVDGLFMTTDASGNLSFADAAEYLPLNITADTTTSYTLVLADGGNMVTMNNAAVNDLVIPTNASVAFPIGTEIVVSQFGAGQTTFISAGGSPAAVTIFSTSGFVSLAEQYSTATLVKVATDSWLLTGDIV